MRYDGRRLGELLEHQGRKPIWLAGKLGISRHYISKMINNERPIPDEVAERSADLLGVPVEWLCAPETVAAS